MIIMMNEGFLAETKNPVWVSLQDHPALGLKKSILGP